VTHNPADNGAEMREELAPPALNSLSSEVRSQLSRLERLLWQDAAEVDISDAIPRAHLEALAAAGFYGIFAPLEAGGLGLDYLQMCAIVEELASACVATTFLWAQHFRLLGAMVDPRGPAVWQERLKAPVIAGAVKGGVALTGLLPGPPRLVASQHGDGWTLSGEAPWVSGWGTIDVVVVAARAPDDTVVCLLVDAAPQQGLSVLPAKLSALNGTRTVGLSFDGVYVDGERLMSRETYQGARQQSERLRLNGSFALGLARRCCELLGPTALDKELLGCRERLDSSQDATIGEARAAACELAVRSAHALAVSRGSSSALSGDVAERLSREAALLLVFGSRPSIKDGLLRRFNARGKGG